MPFFIDDPFRGVVGPLSADEVKHLARSNQLDRTTLISNSIGGRWRPAGEVSWLFLPLLSVPPPPPPPPIRDHALAIAARQQQPQPQRRDSTPPASRAGSTLVYFGSLGSRLVAIAAASLAMATVVGAVSIVSPVIAVLVGALLVYWCVAWAYFCLVQMAEDSAAMFILLLAVAGFAGSPVVLASFFMPFLFSSLFIVIANLLAVGSSIKLCVNGQSPTFCAT